MTRIPSLLCIVQSEPPRPALPALEADDSSGARAVEVVAMLGDSVIGVKHCIDPKGGKVQRATWALIAVGVASLVAFGLAFWTAVDNAADNQRRYDYETSVLQKPGFLVRPEPLPGGYDWIAFGGLFASIVTCTTALARMRKERQSPFVRIGTAPGVEFPLADAPAPDFAIVAPQGDDFAFCFGHGMEGEILVGGKSTSLAELAEQGRTTISPIPADAKIRVRAGTTTFLVSSITRPRRHAVPLLAVDRAFATSLASTTAACALILLVLFRIPIEGSGTSFEVASLEETATRWEATDPEAMPPPEIDGEHRDEESGGGGTSLALDKGLGHHDSDRDEGRYKLDQHLNQRLDPQLARQQAIELARHASILATPALVTGDAFDALTGTFDLSSGFEDTTLLLGNEGFGFARSTFGPGGGGTGWGTTCGGDGDGCKYGTIGHGAGTGSGYGVGGGRCGVTTCRGHLAATPTVSIGQPIAIGDLDKAIIRRYVKRNIDKITYCYEKQLLANPHLSGTVSTQFLITPSGNVASATAAGVNVEVANCVADVIEGIEFPKPSGGATVQVHYPFTFRSASM